MIENRRYKAVNKASHPSQDFSKIKIGVKSLDDAVLDVGTYKATNPRLGDKKTVLDAIDHSDYDAMRDISNFFYKTCGIYSRLCRYLAYLYNYDWMITPYMVSSNIKTEKVLNNFNKALSYFDNFGIKRFFGEVALKVVKNGCYYGYIIRDDPSRMMIQELPCKYCRSRFEGRDRRPAVEFNMSYFDNCFSDTTQRQRILKMFPDEFTKGYRLYKEGKLVGDFPGDTSGWYLLDIDNTLKFNLNGEDYPIFISVIPAIIDLDDAEGLYKKKMQQQLQKIIIQQMPVDKNGDMIFDPDEVQVLHSNAVGMLGRAVGVDVLTTFADVSVADMSDKTATTNSTNELDAIKDIVFDESGVSMNQFNTDGNIALEKSISNDEALMYNLIVQFEDFLNRDLLRDFNTKPKQMYFKAQILKTTIYNYEDLAKTYKEQTQLGYSKMLPQIALGQSQSSILANAHFENDILDLVNVFIPPLMSSTMNADVLDKDTDKGAGRQELDDDEKSEKTIANRESMN
ncbi:MAG: hypothetical protein LUC37_02835 [Prevotella sp.]|nr:hypothetical protein [Prevotella sp.]